MKERIHALDGLRAIAACLVVLHHLGVASFASALQASGHSFAGNLLRGSTASGVELFFVLSAIVLARPYLRSARPMNLRTYAARRASRLLPPYWAAWLVAGLAIALATAFPTWWTKGAALPPFSMRDWLLQVGLVYSGRHYNFAWWSLTVEVAFYALLPLLIPLFTRLGATGTGAAFLVSVGLALFAAPLLQEHPVAYNLCAYLSCFCAGLVLARIDVPPRTAGWLCAVGVVWILAASRYEQLNVHIGWGAVYFGLAATAMNPKSALSRSLSGYQFTWLGERSYSLFLVHYSVIGLVCHAASFAFESKTIGYLVLTRLVSIALTLVATILMFQLVEKRFAHGLVTGGDVYPFRRRLGAETAAT
jgi:peptidoglycan/LPS O-acetylase OafA/YrhL